MSKCPDEHICKIKQDSEGIEKPYYERHAEDGIRLIKENKEHFAYARDGLSGSDVQPSFKEAVRKLEQRVPKSQQKADQKIKGQSILMMLIEEIVFA